MFEGGKCGDGRAGGDAVWFTVLWFDGRMLSDGEPGSGGGSICWVEARLDVVAST